MNRLAKRKLDRAALPRHASPAKEAKDGQHNKDDDDDQKPGRHGDSFRWERADSTVSSAVFATCAVRGERNDSRLGERLRKTSQHREVGVKLDTLKPTHSERGRGTTCSASTRGVAD